MSAPTAAPALSAIEVAVQVALAAAAAAASAGRTTSDAHPMNDHSGSGIASGIGEYHALIASVMNRFSVMNQYKTVVKNAYGTGVDVTTKQYWIDQRVADMMMMISH